MRLSEWRARAPHKNAESSRIAAVIDPVLETFGAGPDPHCWVAWGDDPSSRFTIFAPTDPGLVSSFVRIIPGEGPRATTKLIRWNRVAIGELAVETQGGHRLLSFQLEQQVLRGVDAEADQVAAFALRVIAAIDGRPLPPVEETRGRRGARAGSKTATTKRPSASRATAGTKPAGSAAASAKPGTTRPSTKPAAPGTAGR
jgi:hypothetical protein